jgi:hypothetical protein
MKPSKNKMMSGISDRIKNGTYLVLFENLKFIKYRIAVTNSDNQGFSNIDDV